ncbi:MAG: 3-hydroxyacyl-CoA dehydrogenase [Rhodobacter sp.]|nr:3-hydroxyacyl-CoA dehydrogenase [Paracoccaceae bacterium]MCC0075444.1 3-hydroxyacyl-CoA dehydrogenase [Rhodobacter sp.]
MADELTVACLGAGLIGASWAGLFSAAGHAVRLYDPAPGALEAAAARVAQVHADLIEIGVLTGRMPGAVTYAASLAEAVTGADHVQENAPERLDLKRALFAEIRQHAPEAILASSTSTFPPSELFEGIAGAGRALVVHPMLPPHLMPIAEIVPGPATDPAAVEATAALIRSTGHEVIRLKRETPGFVLNRLQFALLAESYQLVDRGICDPVELDRAVVRGLGYRWACIGPLTASHLMGDGGFAGQLRAYGPAVRRVMSQLNVTEPWSDVLADTIDAPLRAEIPLDSIPAARDARDARLKALRRLRAAD